MRRFILLACLMASAEDAFAQPRLTEYVNPFIGTGGHGHTYPGPSLPFGMIQPGPDTRLEGWDGCSGYHYSDSRVYGFSHTHLSGTGIPDYTDVLLMPMTGDLRFNNGADGRRGYSSSFTHAEETASPGYYAVNLRDHRIRAELTTTLRVGMHRYVGPAAEPVHVVLDLAHRDRLLETEISVVGDREVAGLRRSSSWARDQVVYFVIRFSRPFEKATPDPAAPRVKHGFSFGAGGGPLLVKVAISTVSVDGARRNMDAELPGWAFDDVRAAARETWERELGRIAVRDSSRANLTKFYTALYHAMLSPNVYMDVDGQYRGRDHKIHKAEGFVYYSVFSLWDTFRSLHPLLTLIDPDRTRDFVKTFLRQFEEGGRLPVWELAANETDTMIGYHAVPVIADALVKGIDGIDVELAYRAMRHSAEEDRLGLAAYRRDGFIDASEEAEGVSRTLEYAYDDWAIAQVAQRVGDVGGYQRYMRRAQSYKHVFDPATGFMRARVEGFWATPFDPAEVNNHYTEANAWQYSFFVPHDISGLIGLHRGDATFVRKLDAMFAAPSVTTGRDQADITGLIGQYAHGNEPSHHMAYLYAYAGRPWKTQAMVRRILDTLYGTGPDGLSGNEDCGQMSAWFVLSALGLYPVLPGSTQYVLSTPLFDEARIQLAGGKSFTLSRTRGSSTSPYLRDLRLNGRPHHATFIAHATLAAGGAMTFATSATPAVAWGRAAARPYSAIEDTRVVPVPFVSAGQRLFRGVQVVRLGNAQRGVEIHYTLDGSMPTRASPRYAAGIRLSGGATLKAVAFHGSGASPVMSVTFRQLTDYPRVALSARYAPQYAAAGDDTLVDGLRGNQSFKTGRWQGYRGTDLDVTLDFGAPREVRSVAMGFLQDTGSWILMPRRIIVAVSDDGKRFTDVGAVENAVAEREAKSVIQDLVATLREPVRGRFVRVRVVTYGRLPDWHPGAGEQAWFFADEIVVR